MKRLFAILALTFAAAVSVAAADVPQSVVRFNATAWDFGLIDEDGGTVSHTFEFVNITSKAIVIERVTTSCGCTAADYSRRPIKPSQSGTITVSYNPDGRPGKFSKTVNIAFTGVGQGIQLTVSGEVNPRPRSVADDYPFVLAGGVRADVANRSFGYIAHGKTVSMTVGLVNTSDRRVELDTLWCAASGLLRFDFPAWLEGGERALATLTYSLADVRRYGVVSDCVRMVIDGREADIPLTASAVGVDDFNPQARAVAKASVEPIFHNFGLTKAGATLTRKIEIANRGTAPLVIRSVAPRANTTLSLAEGTVVEPQQSIEAELKFNVPADGFDAVFGGAIIITNDPSRPMRELRVTAEIE